MWTRQRADKAPEVGLSLAECTAKLMPTKRTFTWLKGACLKMHEPSVERADKIHPHLTYILTGEAGRDTAS